MITIDVMRQALRSMEDGSNFAESIVDLRNCIFREEAKTVELWPQCNPWAFAVDQALISVGLDCTVSSSVPEQCVKLLMDHCIDIGKEVGGKPVAVPSSARESLITVLRGGRQCDEEGEEIIMSRQACCEAADMLAADGASAAVQEVWTPEELEKVIERAAEYSDWYVHATPKPPAKPLPLTDEQINSIYQESTGQSLRPQDYRLVREFARAIEAAHGITGEPNHG